MKIFFLIFSLLMIPVWAEVDINMNKEKVPKALLHELSPLSKTVFKVTDLKTGEEKIIDLTGKNFILVSVREAGSDGRFYAVDSDGTVWWSAIITSGTHAFRSPSGIFPLIEKKRYHMSNDFPDPSGVNNMDYMMKFTQDGHALHQGNIDWMSHGCIHLDEKDASVIYGWSTYKTKIVITRYSYMPFAKEDLRKIYLGR